MSAPVKIADEKEVKEALSKITQNTNPFGWLLLGYKDANTLYLQGTGSKSVEEFVDLLDDEQIQYIFLRLPETSKELVEDRRDGKYVTKDIFINWLGPKVRRVERGQKQSHNPVVVAFLKPFHVELTALSKTNLNEKTIRAKSDANSGSHQID